MSRIFKGSESTLRLLISKTDEYKSLANLRIILYTTDIDKSIEVIDGIEMDGNTAIINLAPRAFLDMEDGVINYIVEGVIDGDLYHTERQSNYYLKSLSYINEDGVATTKLEISDNGQYRITPNDGLYVDIQVDLPMQDKTFEVTKNKTTYTITKDDEYAGMKSVNVNVDVEVPVQKSKQVTYTENNKYTITHDEGYLGVEKVDVTVNVPIQDTKYAKLTDNAHYIISKDDEYAGVREVSIDVNVPLQKKQITLTDNDTFSIRPDANYKGIENLDIVVDVPVPQIEPIAMLSLRSGDEGVLRPSDGYDGLEGVRYNVKMDKMRIPNGITLSGSTWEEFDGSAWDWSLVYDCYEMFAECANVKRITGINMRPKDGYRMFRGCSNLEELDLSGCDFSELQTIDMSNMFAYCNALTSLDASGWNTSNVTSMNSTFLDCHNLTTISGIEEWDTHQLKYMEYMFKNCKNLTSIDLSNWDIRNVTSMFYTFNGCTNLTELKMGGPINSSVSLLYTFDGINTNGTFYYPAEHDYSKIINALPKTWTAVAY